ncbi:MAG: hypothetical protein GKS06_03785 [Acidobacteria bacterium]|nr:hypothetical protein [Acidobacteriota bacterium]
MPKIAADIRALSARSAAAVRGVLTGLLAALVTLLPSANVDGQQTQSTKATGALLIDEPVRMDGYLDEAFWARIEPATGFTQREPNPGQAASERTEVRFAYDGKNLYVGVWAFDSDPDAILAKDMQRDGEGSFGGFGGLGGAYRDDDSVALVLDTFLDGRNGFYFETNPNGARADALVENERNANFEWDGVWNVAGRRTDEGWTAEFVIPFSTLRFNPASDTWGVNVRRLIRRKNEEVHWAPIDLGEDVLRVSLAGDLIGMRGLEPGLNLRIKPFGTGSNARDYTDPMSEAENNFEVGLDLLRWGVTNSMTLDLTANTDFAQVEVDDQQVNLTRFSLFFPEKREFFLENAGIFDFANTQSAGGTGRGGPLWRVFHSRTIGIDNGEIIPILAGGRFTGRAGGWNWGLLDVQTDSVDDLGVASTNWGVARLKRNIGARSSVGGIFTNRQSGGDSWNRVLGLDTDINPSQKINLAASATMSRDAGVNGTGFAGDLGFNYRGNVWQASANATHITDDFNPEMGFLLRSGVSRYSYNVNFEPRPTNNAGVRNLSFAHRATYFVDDNGELESAEATLRFFGFDLLSGDRATFFADHKFDRLDQPFEIQDGIFIEAGKHSWTTIGIFVRTDSSRPVSYFGFWTKGGFYNGTRLQGSNGLTIRVNKYLNLNTDWNYNDVDLPGGEFTVNVLRQRVNVALSPNLFWNSFVQYNDSDDLMSLNSRLNWIYRPGADVFLVYNQEWETGADSRPADRAIILKATYLFMF